ncbi:hypothetical protein PsorP6_017871 [Peronosclerospora sorghi]|uniref:Uncharacterized protein n=1 Tax=Peronosclerospora sorghi TaxID=230839 RepID=A0ACC0WEP3_9STRA|nr:hypothetical protein PsorP6_017871 [Peronosclerospora sorghi]
MVRTFNGINSLVLLIASTLWSLFTMEAHIPIGFWHRLLHEIALLLLWSCLVGYLEHNQHIYSIVMTLKWGMPRVLNFCWVYLPSLLDILFSAQFILETKWRSLCVDDDFVFANERRHFHGNILCDGSSPLHCVGKSILYSFISLFMYVVLNIFIAIVEEAFFASQSTRRRLTDYLSHPRVS